MGGTTIGARRVPRSRGTMAKAAVVALAVATTGLASTASAAASSSGYDGDALIDRAHELLAAPSGAQHLRAQPPTAHAEGICGLTGTDDPAEDLVIDIEVAEAAADCEGLLGAAVFTYDDWDDADLEGFLTALDTDRNSATGCEGFEYSVVVVPDDSGSFPGFVFPMNDACEILEPTGPAIGDRDSAVDPTFIAMYWELAAIGSPSSFAFVAMTDSVHSLDVDWAPDPGVALPVLEISDPPPDGVPSARPIDSACTFDPPFEDGFSDVPSTSGHEPTVDCIVYWQVTTGVAPGLFEPSGLVTREQMASFLVRFVEAAGGEFATDPPDAFPDDDTSSHEDNIDKLAAAGIAGGRADGTFGPRLTVTRAQMTTFIVRSLDHLLGPMERTVPDYFTDDDGDPHEPNINRAASLGVAGGTGESTFSPSLPVRRDQMASFLARSLAYLVDEAATPIPEAPPKCPTDETIERTDARCV